MSGVLRGNCCETYRNIPQKTLMNGCTKKNSLTRQILFREALPLFCYNTYISLGIAKNLSDCFWQSNLFFLYVQYAKK